MNHRPARGVLGEVHGRSLSPAWPDQAKRRRGAQAIGLRMKLRLSNPSTPSLVRRGLFLWGISCFALALVSVLVLWGTDAFSFVFWWWLCVVSVFMILYYHYFVTKPTMHARRHAYAVCEHCGHPLTGFEDRSTCPECSKAFDLERTRANWRRIRSRSLAMNLIHGSMRRETVSTPPPDVSSDDSNPFFLPSSMPRLVRRRLWMWRMLAGPLLLLPGVLWLVSVDYSYGPNPRTWWVLSPTSIVLILMIPWYLLIYISHYVMVLRPVVHARRHGYAVCEHCAYTLAGLGERGTCPECAEAFDAVVAMTRWRKARSVSATMCMLYGRIRREEGVEGSGRGVGRGRG